MHLFANTADGFIKGKNGNKYLVFASTDGNKVLSKYRELLVGIKNLIGKIADKPDEYAKDFIKFRFESSDGFPLNKPLKIHALTLIVRCIFQEGNKFYLHLFKWMLFWFIKMLHYDRIDVLEGIDINKTSVSKECIICHYWYFKDIGYKFEPHVRNGCHDILHLDY